MRSLAALLLLLVCLMLPMNAFAAIRASLGYGMQFNGMLNDVFKNNLQRQILNSASQPIVGQSAGTNYSTSWSATTTDEVAPYALINLPELRVSGDWQSGGNTWGFFAALSGIVPQTSAYYAGAYDLKEAKTCGSVDYANCPLAAVGFVSSSTGTGTYDIEVRTAMRLYSVTAGMTWEKAIGTTGLGRFAFVAEAGLNFQSFNAYTQFAATRCSNGASAPCSQIAQSRVVQGELNTQSLFALGPYLGVTLRLDKAQTNWFAELTLSSVFLVTRMQNTGYTNFVGGTTAAFSQTSAALAIDDAQTAFAVLPAFVLRAGYRLGGVY